ncbi:molybdopterin-binding protein [Acidovorax sp. Be4]|uniref:Molybdopterin-binding protein n=1 Tax=Acidovorax bellezanensis TaxID=2976702 RepID=A0ABT2PHH3_9BURK|nr:molybdopterin-binding protein [Acidovorax sp. Be4]MCT9809224.1 molybdopterin-binding protein [Acidovorax sp. Be4]
MDLQFGALIIGDEILSGKRADKHLTKLIELLSARGLTLSHAEYVGDDRPLLTAALSRAFDSASVVFSFGGIGATPDDHTRQCAAQALGVPLALHPEAVALIQERMRDVALEKGEAFEPDRPDNLHRLQMGNFPQGATIIPNPYNKIAGFSCAGRKGGAVHFVPGFPVMAWPMVESVLERHYAPLFNGPARQERSVLVFGVGEATLTPLMQQLEATHGAIRVFSLPSVDHAEHGPHVELGLKGPAVDVTAAWPELLAGLHSIGAKTSTELVRDL